jgi:putative peptide zinc metalloprotease protein
VRRLIALLSLTTALLALGPVPAVAGGPNNFVVADATADLAGAPTIVTRQSMVVQSTGTDELTSANVARAFAHDCTGCQAIAVAFQAVLVTGNPHIATPRNFAVAVNLRCDTCAAFAFAFQYVVSTGGPAHLSPAGMLGVEALREEVRNDLATDLTPQDLKARLDDVGARFKALVDAEIVRTGGHPGSGELNEDADAAPAAAGV